MGESGSSAARTTRLGSKPSSIKMFLQVRVAMAMGKIPLGCGLMTTGFPVARLANRAGYAFQVGNVPQQTTAAVPLDMSRYFLSICVGVPLEKERSKKAVDGILLIAQ